MDGRLFHDSCMSFSYFFNYTFSFILFSQGLDGALILFLSSIIAYGYVFSGLRIYEYTYVFSLVIVVYLEVILVHI